ncbi:hypothetical protein [Massilia yuzhufengensis]|uniref:Uncharacterized protein n=1 Tax=Massilia yuzhufengensis TaxID=1164594 RepID=A0A1I1GUW0_9BURK|nr:hypothetical protein [Massilia yuzhufengensis]SFC15321.1 hypothetical protein SAMN05216204_10475 [Massilia yuzhufengensis]
MARETWAYREVAVESKADPRTGRLRIQPVPGQAYATTLRVQCSRALLDTGRYPPGTRFLLSAKLTDRLGGQPFLYAWHGDPVDVMSAARLKRFIEERRRLRI